MFSFSSTRTAPCGISGRLREAKKGMLSIYLGFGAGWSGKRALRWLRAEMKHWAVFHALARLTGAGVASLAHHGVHHGRGVACMRGRYGCRSAEETRCKGSGNACCQSRTTGWGNGRGLGVFMTAGTASASISGAKRCSRTDPPLTTKNHNNSNPRGGNNLRQKHQKNWEQNGWAIFLSFSTAFRDQGLLGLGVFLTLGLQTGWYIRR